jgi:hypothetical protein
MKIANEASPTPRNVWKAGDLENENVAKHIRHAV